MKFFDYQAKKVWIAEGNIFVELQDGRQGKLPVHQFKRLANAEPDELANFEVIDGYAISWPTLDEDLSIKGFFVKAGKEISLT